jgi:dolichol-phosphate mannosyltransferase
MSSQEKLALVIPTLGEFRCLPILLAKVREALACLNVPFEILVVDDDSGDGTEELVGSIAAEDPRVRLLVRRGERGLAGAILHGWQHTDASLLGVMDADLQHPPGLLTELLAAMQGDHDLAIASRYAGRSGMQLCHPLRRWVSAVSVWMTWPLQRVRSRFRGAARVKDPLSGYFIVRRHCVESIAFQTTGFKLLLEILMRGRVVSAVEIPFTLGLRKAGRSKAGAKVAWDYLQLLARLYLSRWSDVRLPAGISTD